MRIVVNGRERDVAEGTTVADLIDSLGLRSRNVVVELNGEALERTGFTHVLSKGDRIEVVRAVQGG